MLFMRDDFIPLEVTPKSWELLKNEVKFLQEAIQGFFTEPVEAASSQIQPDIFNLR